MSSETSKVLAAAVIAVAVVVAAVIMAEPRYQSFAQEGGSDELVRGVFDTRTGRVCYTVISRDQVRNPDSGRLFFCASEVD